MARCRARDGGPRAVWKRPAGVGHADAAVVGGRVILFHREEGREIVAGLDVRARCRPLVGTVRALPALAAGRLYLRDDATLTCLDVAP